LLLRQLMWPLIGRRESRGVAAIFDTCYCPSSTQHDMTTVIVLGQAY